MNKTLNLKEVSNGRKDIFLIDPRLISVKQGFNVREDFGDIDELKLSIKENGVLNPLKIFNESGKIFLADGERRFRAVSKLLEEGHEIKSVPCISEERGVNEETRVLRLMLYNDGKPLTPLEEANAINRLLNFGWTPEQISNKTGRSLGHISNLKLLISLPQEIVNEVKDNSISSTLVIDLARQCGENSEKLKETLKKAKEKAKELGKKKVTKKIVTEGTTKRTNKQEKKQKLLDLIDLVIKALKGGNEIEQFDAIEKLQLFRGELTGEIKSETINN